MRSERRHDIETGCPATAAPGTSTAPSTGATASNAATCTEEAAPARRTHTANALPSSSSATSGESSTTPGVVSATGTTSLERRDANSASEPLEVPTNTVCSPATARPLSSVAPDSGFDVENGRADATTWPPAIHATVVVAARAPAGSSASRSVESFVAPDQPPGPWSSIATNDGLPVSVKSQTAVVRPSGVITMSVLQSELPAVSERGSNAPQEVASAAFSDGLDVVVARRAGAPRPDRGGVAGGVHRHPRRLADAAVPSPPRPAPGRRRRRLRPAAWPPRPSCPATTPRPPRRCRRRRAQARVAIVTGASGGETSPQSPPAGRKRVCTANTGPCIHASVASPWRSTAIAGLKASRPGSDRSRAGPKPPPGSRCATATRVFAPSKCSNAAKAVPSRATASDGADPADTSVGREPGGGRGLGGHPREDQERWRAFGASARLSRRPSRPTIRSPP